MLVGAKTVEEAAQGVLAAVAHDLGWQLGIYWTVDRETEALRPLAHWQSRARLATRFLAESNRSRFARGEGLPGRAWQEAAPFALRDLDAQASFPRARWARADKLRSALLFPLSTGREIFGVIELWSRELRRPPIAEIGATLTAIGHAVGLFVERQRADDARRDAEDALQGQVDLPGTSRARLDDALERERQERVRVENALRASEAKARRLYQSDAIGIVVGDLSGPIKEANDEFLRLTGHSRADLDAGKLRWDTVTPPEWLPRDMEAVAALRSQGVTSSYEKELLHASGARVPILVSGALIGGDDYIGFVLDNTKRKLAEHALAHLNLELEERVRARTESLVESESRADATACALARSEQRLRALTAHLHTVREEERTLLAREIHDVLGQELTGFRLDVAWILRRLNEDPPLTRDGIIERLAAMERLIDASIGTVRRIATELRPGVLDDLGLMAALEWQAREFQRRSGITVHLTMPGDDLPLEHPRATAVFRIFQELLTNVARHAGARNVYVRVERAGTRFVLEVRDDGRGISEIELAAPSALGLLGMRERALAAGGVCNIAGAPGKGTVARLEIPLQSGQAGKELGSR